MFINIITIAAFLALVATVFIVRALVVGWRGTFDAQLAGEIGGGYTPTDPVFAAFPQPLAEQLPLLGPTDDSITHDLRRAGYYKASARNEFLALRNLMAISVVVFTAVIAVMIGPERR